MQMKKIIFYPAVFHEAEEGGYWVTFPDLPECITEGDSMEEAYEMAVDALKFALTNKIQAKEELPAASDVEMIYAEGRVAAVPFKYIPTGETE